ncbi:acyltransferase family protein [Hymenobacter wooponensis]|uniref:Acyltransferase n=1 Tax=Hymenobacter wooponensis TaxID=1525360 RepID=A0A4Z0ML65_9BACT|nr:acyltransferase [Hymenobacter wooponensis]TGD80301.1 acyltransferase [Hymenobacter wooponensis]
MAILPKSIRYYEIDLMRFLAALSVVFYHFTYRGYQQGHFMPTSFPALAPVTKYGWLGVQLFFMISGYVVLMSAQGKTVKQFFLSRVTRLYPAYWVCCTLTFVFFRAFGPRPGQLGWSDALDVSLTKWLVNLTMLQEFVGAKLVDLSYWSLTIELTFYFLISLVVAYRLFNSLPALLLLWLGYVAITGPDPGDKAPFFTLFFPNHAPFFAAGMVFYLLQKKFFAAWQLYSLLALSFVLGIRSIRAETGIMQSIFKDTNFSPVVAAVAVVTFFVLFWLLIKGRLHLPFSWLSRLGAMTYPLYLLHSSIGWVVFQRLDGVVNKYVLLFGLIAVMMLMALGIHYMIERRFAKPLGEAVDGLLSRLSAHLPTRQV